MHDRPIASRLWRGCGVVVTVAAGALASAPLASAGTVAPVVYTPTNGSQLYADVQSADTAPAGTLSIIQLSNADYQPTNSTPAPAELILTGNIEITGPPTDQVPSGDNLGDGNEPDIDGSQVFTNNTPLIQVNSGNVVIKGVNISSGGTTVGQGAVQVAGGTVEIDNSAIDSSDGTGLVATGGTVTATNSDISDGNNNGVQLSGNTATITLVNDTIYGNNSGGVTATSTNISHLHMYNTILANNAQSGTGPNCSPSGSSFASLGNFSSDNTCTGSATSGLNTDFAATNFNGGPTYTTQLTGGPAVNGGVATYCPTADQRFFLYTKGTNGVCNSGSYQSNGAAPDTSTTGPACSIASINEGTNPETEVVDIFEPSGQIGMGADAVDNTTTNNGSVGYPVVGSSWFNAVNPSLTIDEDYPSTAAYAVTASKPLGNTAVTMWSFWATDWLGNTRDLSTCP